MTPADRAMLALLAAGYACLAAGFFMVSTRFGLIALGCALIGTAWRAMQKD